MWIIKDWCVVTERVYKADVARGCVRNPLQPIMLPKARNSAIQAWLALSASCWEDVDNGLKDKYIEIQAAYAWILDGWFSTTLKIRETYMTNKIGPRSSGWWELAGSDKRGRTKSISLRCQQPRCQSPISPVYCYNGGQPRRSILLKKLSENSSLRQWYDI